VTLYLSFSSIKWGTNKTLPGWGLVAHACTWKVEFGRIAA
jgi:hypothetical protein